MRLWAIAMPELLLIAWGSVFIDLIIGDPRTKLHPVVLIGNAIALLEKLLYRRNQSPVLQLLSGGMLVCLVLASCYMAALAIEQFFTAYFPEQPALSIFISMLLLYCTISPHSLSNAGREIAFYLEQGNLPQARCKVGWIVGRDTKDLDVPDITRAAIETIAENIVDGIISPLFYFFLGGAPLAVLYRAVNTIDSMIGYKNDRYLFFGRIGAKMDDILNYIPARITGLLLVIAAFLLRLQARDSWRMMKRDASKHPSPNGGYPEGAVAGALGIRLGGLNYYFGQPSFRAYMGDSQNELAPQHIYQTIRLMYASTFLFLAIASIFIAGGIFF